MNILLHILTLLGDGLRFFLGTMSDRADTAFQAMLVNLAIPSYNHLKDIVKENEAAFATL